MPLVSRAGQKHIEGLDLEVPAGVHDPAPVPLKRFTALHRAGICALAPNSRVLELGAGTGLWALLAAQAGHEVAATELTTELADLVQRNAERNALSVKVLVGDLFEPVQAVRFDAVLFNPPFHDGTPTSSAERAWIGGATVRRFLSQVTAHLTAHGLALMQLPRIDGERYVSELSKLSIRTRASVWFPLVGWIDLLELT